MIQGQEDSLLGSLSTFLFNPSASTSLATHESGFLVFAMACAIVGLAIVLCDWSYTNTTRNPSVLGLVYNGWRIALVFAFWVIGSGVIGYVVVATELMQLTIQSCISVGITWTVLIPKVLSQEPDEVDATAPEAQQLEQEELDDDLEEVG